MTNMHEARLEKMKYRIGIAFFIILTSILLAHLLRTRVATKEQAIQRGQLAPTVQVLPTSTVQIALQRTESFIGRPFFVTSWGKTFDQLQLEDVPQFSESYLKTHQRIYIARNRVFEYGLDGTLRGISDPDIVESASHVVQFNDSLFVFGNGRLVEISAGQHKVVWIYDLPQAPADVLAGQKYIWISHAFSHQYVGSNQPNPPGLIVGGLTQIDPVLRKIVKKWTYAELGLMGYPASGLSLQRGLDSDLHITFFTYEGIRNTHAHFRITINEQTNYIQSAMVTDVDTKEPIAPPLQLRSYYAIKRRDADSYYLASNTGIDLLVRDSLSPYQLAQTDALYTSSDKNFVDQNFYPYLSSLISILIESVDKKYVAHLVLHTFAYTGNDMRAPIAIPYQLFVYDTHTKRHTFSITKSMNFANSIIDSKSVTTTFENLIQGDFRLKETNHSVILELDGRHILETQKP